MIYGCDSAGPPDTLDAQAIWHNGWRFFFGYLGGPRCAYSVNGVGLGRPGRLGWGIGAFARVQSVGFLLGPPIYVGRTAPYDDPWDFNYEQGLADGDDANNMMGQSGFNETQPLCLDAEYGDWQNEPTEFKAYLGGFVERCNAVGHNVLLYSDMATLDSIADDGSLVDFKWGAGYGRRAPDTYRPTSRKPPYGMYDPSSPPPWAFWQFNNGARYDVNSAVESAPFALCTPP